MPPIGLHLVLADRLSKALDNASVRDHLGPYLLGSTAPDIRILTREDRRMTHFFDLSVYDHQDSVGAFLSAHDHLVDPGRLNADTRGFVAGYISHLVMDEVYITRVYREYFRRHDEMGGSIRANVMDRLLQFDLERTYGNDPGLSNSICAALSCTLENVNVGFIEAETLERWRGVAKDVAERNMDWERMRGMIANHLSRAGMGEGAEASEFLDSLPALLDETIAHVTNAEVDGFIERSLEAAAGAVEAYLK
jgi:hypothetical protein